MIMSIDIGTSYSSSCISGPDGLARPVEIGTGASMFGSRFSLPSAVFVEENGDILVGQAAMNSRKRKPENFRMEFKRNFGETYPILLGNRSFLPEELYTELLRHIKACAEKASGEKVELAYLTHPATYGKARVEKLCIAARAAGLFDVETVDEPTAAAMNYCAAGYIQDGQTLLVYDFGGGTFDVSLIRYENGEFSPLSESEGLEQCGGIDIDRLIYQDMLSTVGSGLLAQLQTNPLHYKRFAGQLSELAVKAKHHLSAAKIFEEPIEIGFEMIPYRLTLDRFNQMVAPLVGQTITTCHLILKNAGLTCSDLSAILMVGGTSRVPLVQEMVRQFAGQIPVHCADDLELAVAQGAINYRQYCQRPTPPVPAPEPTPPPTPVPNPIDLACEWYREGIRLEKNGDPQAMQKALSLYRKAAERDHAEANYALGRWYEEGLTGVKKNPQTAFSLYTKAAELGSAEAYLRLGYCYEFGIAVPENSQTAWQHYCCAAEAGCAEAQYLLGWRLGMAVGLGYYDPDKAVFWCRKAAGQGHKEAQEKLGILEEKEKKAKQHLLQKLAPEAVRQSLAAHPSIKKGVGSFSEKYLHRSRRQMKVPMLDHTLLFCDTSYTSDVNGFILTDTGIYCKYQVRVLNYSYCHFSSWYDFVTHDLKNVKEKKDGTFGGPVSLKNGATIGWFCGDGQMEKSLILFWIDLQKTLRKQLREHRWTKDDQPL